MLDNLPLIVFLICFVLMFVLRMPIPTGMIAACTMYFLTDGLVDGNSFIGMITGQEGQLHLVAQKTIEAIFTNTTIIAVPLFIFAANVMNAGKITEYVFGVCKGLVGRFPGGLAHVNVLASLVFSGMTGSAVADASGLGKMEIDAMRAEGYDDGFSCAITAASATIGPIFPPSIPAVIYAMLTGASVGALFMAGMMPGVILAVCLCVYVAFISKKRNYPKSAPPQLGAYLRYCFKAIWALLTPVILLVGIYTGVMTPTEAGAIAGALRPAGGHSGLSHPELGGPEAGHFRHGEGHRLRLHHGGRSLRHLLHLRQGARSVSVWATGLPPLPTASTSSSSWSTSSSWYWACSWTPPSSSWS